MDESLDDNMKRDWMTIYGWDQNGMNSNLRRGTGGTRWGWMRKAILLAASIALGLAFSGTHAAQADDGIFPAAPQARSVINFDNRGFLIHGQRTFIASAGLEYARIPHELWRDRLLRIKRAGFNCVEIYTFWNFHEPQEGKFDFTEDHDLDAFLKLAHSLDLYVIARVGPYYCAEWDSGGYPIWLRFKPGVQVRVDNALFEQYVDRFFDKLIPIIAANQINRGGSVILVQLENEHPAGWGRDMPNPYFTHLRNKALALGLEVPHFFSGLHHGSDPGGNRPWDSEGRSNPWMSTEFWTVWYSDYGEVDAGTVRKFDRATWKIIAFGGNGYNYYMFHGGSNFGYTNNNEDAASYDYSAPIGQAGDLRTLYYRFKRAALFARSFSSVLENSRNATDTYKAAANNPKIRVLARQSPAGTILFLDNGDSAPQPVQIQDGGAMLPTAGPVTLAPGEIMPVVMDYKLLPNVTIHRAAVRILNIAQQGATTTLVVYGPPGASGEMSFDVPADATIAAGAAGLTKASATQLLLRTSFSNDTPAVYSFKAGDRRVRILAMSDSLADRTWFVDAGAQSFIVCGPHYVGDATLIGGGLRIQTETGPIEPSGPPMQAFGEGDTPMSLTYHFEGLVLGVPALGAWEYRPASRAAAGENTTSWMASADPLPMGADGDLSAYAWYRTILNVPQAGQYTLSADSMGDYLETFLDGKRLPDTARQGNHIQMNLTQGRRQLAFFAEHFGRDKLVGHLGPIGNVDVKGVSGKAGLSQPEGAPTVITEWRALKAPGNANDRTPLPSDEAVGWFAAKAGEDIFQKQPGAAWYRTVLPAGTSRSASLHFDGIDDEATVFLDGKKVGGHNGWGQPFDVSLDNKLSPNAPAVLTVLIINRENTGGITGPVTFTRYGSMQPVTGWKLRGGPGDPSSLTGWQPAAAAPAMNGPAFFRTSFTATPPQGTGDHPIWRVTFKGLSHGSMWLNGHNLGRYPEKIPINGLYLPEPWLVNGTNHLVIFDDNGSSPAGVTLEKEVAASRWVAELAAVR